MRKVFQPTAQVQDSGHSDLAPPALVQRTLDRLQLEWGITRGVADLEETARLLRGHPIFNISARGPLTAEELDTIANVSAQNHLSFPRGGDRHTREMLEVRLSGWGRPGHLSPNDAKKLSGLLQTALAKRGLDCTERDGFISIRPPVRPRRDEHPLDVLARWADEHDHDVGFDLADSFAESRAAHFPSKIDRLGKTSQRGRIALPWDTLEANGLTPVGLHEVGHMRRHLDVLSQIAGHASSAPPDVTFQASSSADPAFAFRDPVLRYGYGEYFRLEETEMYSQEASDHLLIHDYATGARMDAERSVTTSVYGMEFVAVGRALLLRTLDALEARTATYRLRTSDDAAPYRLDRLDPCYSQETKEYYAPHRGDVWLRLPSRAARPTEYVRFTSGQFDRLASDAQSTREALLCLVRRALERLRVQEDELQKTRNAAQGAVVSSSHSDPARVSKNLGGALAALNGYALEP